MKVGLRKVAVSGTLVAKGDVLTAKSGVQYRKFDLKDSTGAVALTLFEEHALTPDGAKVEVENGYTGEYKGTLQLNVGKFGRLNILAN